ncbi:glycerophosphodiester phosphodiesterase family protein [Microvirga tunisiensis]|uniref:Glycerophosphodiester phosphodiesterase n=1 Tax=Microvirga tunisiensis TaxID=2108360 RepID=A0A5N7MGL2_9HYPH|nr:glycerophosphodiester phosphodiesterase family protein [Microvirga tunisiensis]MPR07787.1 glycerophosphodiester phosphodiesterase [Microvirga tunisiensis]MPR26182.1 glycerophosphodiester phosphodiesterase [Microvirga tunisiensis]
MRIIGHRGARNIWAENSLSGFRNVCGLGVDAVELDVHLSSDGEIMVIHDPLLDRTTDHKGPVGNLSRDALARVRVNDTLGETIPTLPEVLDVFGPTGIELEIEMKTDAFGNPYPGLLDKVIALVEAHDMSSRVVLTCFVPEVIEEIRAKAPGMRRLASVDRRSCEAFGSIDRTLRRFVDLGCIVAVEQSLLRLTVDRAVEIVGRDKLGVWVPNTVRELDYWLSQPISQITSDRPDLALHLRTARKG